MQKYDPARESSKRPQALHSRTTASSKQFATVIDLILVVAPVLNQVIYLDIVADSLFNFAKHNIELPTVRFSYSKYKIRSLI